MPYVGWELWVEVVSSMYLFRLQSCFSAQCWFKKKMYGCGVWGICWMRSPVYHVWAQRRSRGRSYIRVKLAVAIDGCVGLLSQFQFLKSSEARSIIISSFFALGNGNDCLYADSWNIEQGQFWGNVVQWNCHTMSCMNNCSDFTTCSGEILKCDLPYWLPQFFALTVLSFPFSVSMAFFFLPCKSLTEAGKRVKCHFGTKSKVKNERDAFWMTATV